MRKARPGVSLGIVILLGIPLLAYLLSACSGLPVQPVFDSPLDKPTQPPSPLQTPKPSATPTSTLTSTPTPVPTASTPLPTGPKVVYAETLGQTTTFWAALASDPNQRRILTTAQSAQFGVHATLSHDESRIAYVFSNDPTNSFVAELWVVGVDGTNRQQLAIRVDAGRYVNYPIWSPNDRSLAFARQSASTFPYTQTLAIVDAQKGTETVLVEQAISRIEDEGPQWITLLEWSADNAYVYYQVGTVDHTELWRVNVSTKVKELVRTLWESGTPRCYFRSPDGQWLLCTLLVSQSPRQYGVVLVPTGIGQTDTIISGASDELYNPIWHPTGTEVTVNVASQISGPAELQSIDIQTRSARTITSTPDGLFIPSGWSPDSEWVAVQKYPGTTTALYLVREDGSQTNQIWTSGGLRFIGWITGNLP